MEPISSTVTHYVQTVDRHLQTSLIRLRKVKGVGSTDLAKENVLDLVQQIFAQVVIEIVQLMPKILIALVIVALTFVLIKSLNFLLRKVLRVVEFDKMFKELSGVSLPFSIDSLIVLLADFGMALVSLYALIALFIGERYSELVREGLYYGARVASIVLLGIFLLAVFNTLVGRIKIETRLRSYGMFLVLLLVTSMLIDITALSEPVKNALITGLSIGVGVSIGVFAIWFFFHDWLDLFAKTRDAARDDKNPSHTKKVRE